MLNNSQGSQGNNDLQTAQNAIAILIDQISKARGVGRTIVIDKNWLNNQLSALQNSLPAAVHQAQAVLKEKETTLSRAQQEAEMQRQTAADDAQRLKAQAEKEAAAARAEGEKARADAQKDAEAAKQEAERIRELARQEAGELVKRDAIVNAAQHRAENIVERARRDAEALRQDADVYIVDVLQRLEQDLAKTMTVVRNGLEKVQAEQVAAHEAAEVGD